MEKLNIMLTSKEISNLINDYIAHLPYDRKPKSLYEPIQYVLSIGGKRLRPTLMLLVYNMFRDHPEKIVSLRHVGWRLITTIRFCTTI